jgi:TolA-binding protein
LALNPVEASLSEFIHHRQNGCFQACVFAQQLNDLPPYMSSEDTSSTGMLEFLTWVEVNKQRLIVGGCVLVAAAFGAYVVNHLKAEKEMEANGALLSLQKFSETTGRAAVVDAQTYLNVTEKYSGTSAAERALLQAAGALFEAGKYTEAKSKFDEFATRHSGSVLIPTAAFGSASCLDAMNEVDKAMAAYDQIITGYASDFVSTQAKLAKAMLQVTKNQPAEAKRILETIGMEQNNPWQREAMNRLQMLNDKFPELVAKPATNTPAVITPAGLSVSNTVAPAGAKK